MFAIIHLIVTILVLIVICVSFLYLKVDYSKYINYTSTLFASVLNEQINSLQNANTLIHMPWLKFSTTNNEVNIRQNCKLNPMFMETPNELECKKICGSGASILYVDINDEHYVNGTRLPSGNYCVVNVKNCNMKTTYAVATENSITCKPKFPNLFGGETGNTIIAGRGMGSNPILWDYLHNEKVDPKTVVIDSEDELLSNGDFRFRVKYGLDEQENQIVPHPLNRFRPIKDKCISSIYRAPFQAHVNFKSESYECDCGNPQETRLFNISDEPDSECVPFKTDLSKGVIANNCITINTPMKDLKRLRHFCGGDKFLNKGNFVQELVINSIYTDEIKPPRPDNIIQYTDGEVWPFEKI